MTLGANLIYKPTPRLNFITLFVCFVFPYMQKEKCTKSKATLCSWGIMPNICFCDLVKKENHTGLERHKVWENDNDKRVRSGRKVEANNVRLLRLRFYFPWQTSQKRELTIQNNVFTCLKTSVIIDNRLDHTLRTQNCMPPPCSCIMDPQYFS